MEELYIDKASGKNTDRPELKKMMAYVRRGDTVIVESISRFARNTRDLLNLMEQLSAKGVEFVLQEGGHRHPPRPPASLCSRSLGPLRSWSGSTFCSASGRGLKLAKRQGKYKGRKPLVPPRVQEMVIRWKRGEITEVEACRRLGISKATFYRKVK